MEQLYNYFSVRIFLWSVQTGHVGKQQIPAILCRNPQKYSVKVLPFTEYSLEMENIGLREFDTL